MRESKLFEITRYRHGWVEVLYGNPCFFWNLVASDSSRKKILEEASELSFEEVIEKLKDKPADAMALLLEDV